MGNVALDIIKSKDKQIDELIALHKEAQQRYSEVKTLLLEQQIIIDSYKSKKYISIDQLRDMTHDEIVELIHENVILLFQLIKVGFK